MRVAVVFGAGGLAGWLFHAGVARTLRDATGWDVTRADVIVGTSAGAAVGAALRRGTDVDEFIAAVRAGPSDAELADYRARLARRERSLVPLAPNLVRHALAGDGGLAVAVAGLLPRGRHFTDTFGRLPGLAGTGAWPEGLWIPAVRVRDGALVVFGRDRRDVDVIAAVEASSAVPGIFEPKEIAGERYIDGGLQSPTHADLAAAAAPELVIVSSPMTRPSWRPMFVLARRRLGAELGTLAAAGIPVAVVEPRQGVPGLRRREPGAVDALLASADEATRRALARGDLAARLGGS